MLLALASTWALVISVLCVRSQLTSRGLSVSISPHFVTSWLRVASPCFQILTSRAASLCLRFADALLLLCSRFAVDLLLCSSGFAFVLLSLCVRFALVLFLFSVWLSLCSRCALALLSRCSRFALALLSPCLRFAFFLNFLPFPKHIRGWNTKRLGSQIPWH